MVNKKGISIRQQPKIYGVNEKTIRNILKEKNIMCYKRVKAPMYTSEQEKQSRKNS